MAFLAELKRRRVGKVAIAYGAVAWGVTEASSVVLPALHVPEWAMTFIVVFLLVGFPIAMVLAWIFDATADGIQRTEPLPGDAPRTRIRIRAAYGIAVLVAMAGLGYLLYERGLGRAHAGERHGSIAVLPFTNLSGDPAKDYFSDGMSEELLNLLARVPGLQVAARTSAFAYKGKNVDIRQVGEELGVETVLEGSVRQAGDKVRITAQLIDTETGFHLWSETYDRELKDIFAVQDEIAQSIVDRLKIQLAPEEQRLAQRDKAPTQDVEAYELYLQGQAIWKRRGEDNLRRAVDLYQQAIGRDPAFAAAHAALASAYVVMPGYTREEGDEEQFLTMAEQSARQALAIDPKIGEAHAVLAQINSDRGNLLDAESGFFFAISLEPNEPTPHHWYSILLAKVGRLDAGLEQARRAFELDPSSPIIASNLANAYLLRGDDAQAARYARLAEDLGLTNKSSGVAAMIAMRQGRWEDAKRLFAHQDLPEAIKPLVGQWVDAVADPAKRPHTLAAMRRVDPKVIKQEDLLMPYLQLGEVDLVYRIMFDALERDRNAWVHGWDVMNTWASESSAFRRDPRFPDLARRMGLLEYWKQYGFPDGCRAGDRDVPIVCVVS
ncbi:MAG TPA: tetratricopeptide repeat protein [Steroidobacteraceae bacterium]|nr:tetratricopeptide repeat protein [Steroidobacteraceae bacterium]